MSNVYVDWIYDLPGNKHNWIKVVAYLCAHECLANCSSSSSCYMTLLPKWIIFHSYQTCRSVHTNFNDDRNGPFSKTVIHTKQDCQCLQMLQRQCQVVLVAAQFPLSPTEKAVIACHVLLLHNVAYAQTASNTSWYKCVMCCVRYGNAQWQ